MIGVVAGFQQSFPVCCRDLQLGTAQGEVTHDQGFQNLRRIVLIDGQIRYCHTVNILLLIASCAGQHGRRTFDGFSVDRCQRIRRRGSCVSAVRGRTNIISGADMPGKLMCRGEITQTQIQLSREIMLIESGGKIPDQRIAPLVIHTISRAGTKFGKKRRVLRCQKRQKPLRGIAFLLKYQLPDGQKRIQCIGDSAIRKNGEGIPGATLEPAGLIVDTVIDK